MKRRLDELVVELGLAPSRTRAQAMIMAGHVLVNDVPSTKPGAKFDSDAVVRIRGRDHPFVSRGGLKLAGALKEFRVEVEGKTALDVGASTGGFTDVLLQAGAKKVHAIDVGHSQLDWKIRSDPRVVVKEGINARTMTFEDVGEIVDIVVVDVSFISLTKVVPNLRQFVGPETILLTLIKPQFEAGPNKVGKGGIVTDPAVREEVLASVREELESHGFTLEGLIESSIQGTDGNIEYFGKWTLSRAETSKS